MPVNVAYLLIGLAIGASLAPAHRWLSVRWWHWRLSRKVRWGGFSASDLYADPNFRKTMDQIVSPSSEKHPFMEAMERITQCQPPQK